MLIGVEPFWNIDAANPPLFKGPDFDFVRLQPGAKPVRRPQKRVPADAVEPLLVQAKQWLQAGVTIPSTSPHDNGVVIAPKKSLPPPVGADGKPIAGYKAKRRYRVCIDFTATNRNTVDIYVSGAPRVDSVVEAVANFGRDNATSDTTWYISTLDIFQGF